MSDEELKKDLKEAIKVIQTLNLAFETFKVHIEGEVVDVKKIQSAHSLEIWGKDKDNPGLKIDMDRMKQIEQERAQRKGWFEKTIGATTLGLLIDRVFSWWHLSPKP